MQRIFINGRGVEANASASRPVVNPATAKVLDEVPECDAGDVDRAVRAAREALTAWSRLEREERCVRLRTFAQQLRVRRAELTRELVRESGRPACEAADCLEAAARIFERARPLDGNDPGVIAATVSRHHAFVGLALTAAPALAAGHAVVFKPAPQTPLATLKLVELCAGALPPGALNVVTGGAAIERALRLHPDVQRVRCFGPCATGPDRGQPVDLIDARRGAFIVGPGADLDLAASAIAWERLMNAGQGCGSAQHVYVERSIAAALVERLHPCAGFLDVDDPVKLPTDIGPLCSLEAANRAEDQVGRTLRAGARLILGGRRFRPSGLAGYFFQPTLLANVPPGSVPVREEIFGPIVTVTSVASLAEALGLMSESRCEHASIFGDHCAVRAALEAIVHRVGLNDSEAACKACLPIMRVRVNDPEDPAGAVGAALGLPPALRGLMATATLAGAEPRAPLPEYAEAFTPKPWWFPYLERNRRSG